MGRWDDEFFLTAEMTMPNRSSKNTRDLGAGWFQDSHVSSGRLEGSKKFSKHPWFAKEKFKLGELHLDWIGCVFVGDMF